MHKTLEAYFGKNEFTAKKGLDQPYKTERIYPLILIIIIPQINPL